MNFQGLTKNKQRGGAAIEYLLVNLFALFVTIGAISFFIKASKAHLAKATHKLGIDHDDLDFDIFGH